MKLFLAWQCGCPTRHRRSYCNVCRRINVALRSYSSGRVAASRHHGPCSLFPCAHTLARSVDIPRPSPSRHATRQRPGLLSALAAGRIYSSLAPLPISLPYRDPSGFCRQRHDSMRCTGSLAVLHKSQTPSSLALRSERHVTWILYGTLRITPAGARSATRGVSCRERYAKT